jgi:hypothetical protein
MKFRISVRLPILCGECGGEIPESELQPADGQTMACLCEPCLNKFARAEVPSESVER